MQKMPLKRTEGKRNTFHKIINSTSIPPIHRENNGVIYCADCLSIMKDWPDNCVDLVVTSPPYNLVRENTGGGPNSGKQWKSHEQRQYKWYEDTMPESKYKVWQSHCIKEMIRVCRGSVFYNHKIRYAIGRRKATYHPYQLIQNAGVPLWCEIIWDRGIPGAGNWPRHCPQEERLYQLGRPVKWNGYDGGNIWRLPPSDNKNGHPCSFPLGIPAKCIRACSGPENIILDPFCGSGTTCVAAKMLGRRYIGIDISEKYCEIARQRLEAVDTGVPVKEQKAGQMHLEFKK